MLTEGVTWSKELPLLFDLGNCCLLTKFLIQGTEEVCNAAKVPADPKV